MDASCADSALKLSVENISKYESNILECSALQPNKCFAEQFLLRLSGSLDEQRIQNVMSCFIDELLTCFNETDFLGTENTCRLEQISWVNIEPDEQITQLLELVEAQRALSFEVGHESLIRVHLVKLSNQEHTLLFTVHALILARCSLSHIEHTFQNQIAEFLDVQITHESLPWFKAQAKSQLTNSQFNRVLRRDYPKTLCIHHLLEEQAKQVSTLAAVVHDETSISFAELNNKANQLAHKLVAMGINKDAIIGICLSRSTDFIVAAMAILKAGGAFLPLDPTYPKDRLAYMVQDSKLQIVITSLDMQANVCAETLQLTAVLLDDEKTSLELAALPTSNLDSSTHSPDQLAYVIYTSGTTGQAKGVMVNHRGLVNLIWQDRTLLDIRPADRMLHCISLAFDAGIQNLLTALCSGASVYLTDAQADLMTLMQTHLISHAFFPVSLLAVQVPTYIPSLRMLMVGGEACPVSVVENWGANTRLINAYGPTEASVTATIAELKPQDKITIGRAIPNVQVHILDHALNAVEQGQIGEIYIGGVGVARGYLGREELTASSFIRDPFSNDTSMRLYKTGDLGCWTEQGEIEYHGRADDQVKIRGYRIELGEITQKLCDLPEVKEGLVVVHQEGGSKHLVAYFVASENIKVEPLSLEQQLEAILPQYMLPSAFVELEAFPLTTNGKIDKRALPKPEIRAMATNYLEARNDDEAVLCQLWENILGISSVGIEDDFYQLGGDSILAIQMVSQANKLGFALSTKNVTATPTIAALALCKNKAERDAEQSEVQGELPLLPIQKFYLEETDAQIHDFSQALLLSTPAGFDLSSLEAIVEALYQRHDALRLQFNEQANSQWIASHKPLQQIDIKEACSHVVCPAGVEWSDWLTQQCNEYREQLNIFDGPLLQAVFFEQEDQGRLYLAVHHLIVDGVSWRILLADIEEAYEQWAKGTPIKLGEKTSSLQSWGKTLHDYSHDEQLQKELGFWQSQLADVPALPLDHLVQERPRENTTAVVHFELSHEKTHALLHNCHHAYHTQINDLLLAGLYLGSSAWSGLDAFRVVLESHGRSDLFEQMDTSQTLGWFTAAHPLRMAFDSHQVRDVIIATKELVHGIPNKGFGFGILSQLGTQLASEPYENSILFNYLGQFDSKDEQSARFLRADDKIGDDAKSKAQRRWHQLNVNAKVIDGHLKVEIDFSELEFDSANIQHFASELAKGLELVIAHCCESDTSSFTCSDFPVAKVTQAQLDAWQSTYPSLEDLYPATAMQQGMMFHSLVDKSAYATQQVIHFKGEIDIDALQQAWACIVQRHKVFRSVFVGADDVLHQLVQSDVELPWQVLNWHSEDEAVAQSKRMALMHEERHLGFDFEQAPLMRFSLLRMPCGQWQLIWTHHHMLLDGWCLPLLTEQVQTLYQTFLEGNQPNLPKPADYGHYVKWLADRPIEQAQDFWHSRLADVESPTQLPWDGCEPEQGKAMAVAKLVLDKDSCDALKTLARDSQVTMSTVLQLAWGYLLSCYSSESKVVFGTTVSGRPADLPGADEMIGLFINTLPISTDFSDSSPLVEQLKHLHNEIQNADEHGYLSLTEIQSLSGCPAEQGLFDSIFVMQIAGMKEAGSSAKLQIAELESTEQTNFAMTLAATVEQQCILELNYKSDVFSAQRIESLLARLRLILNAMPTWGSKPIQGLSVLSESERMQLTQWAGHYREFDPHLCMHHLFERQVDKTPDAIALVYQDECMTYRELDQAANALAHKLKAAGTGDEQLVGIYLDRSNSMIIAMLAVLKAGAAYVPIDPSYPQDRVRHMLSDSCIEIVLTQNHYVDEAELASLIKIEVTQEVNSGMPRLGLSTVNASSLAYAIYTSGSTGLPKATLLEHKGLVNLAQAQSNSFSVTSNSKVAHFASMTFDAATSEWGMALVAGAQLHILPEDIRTQANLLQRVLVDNEISHITLPPALLPHLEPSELGCLKHLIVAGDACSKAQADRWLSAERTFYNAYGPSEASVCASIGVYKGHGAALTIGKPLDNVLLYVVDSHLNQVAPGIIGELLIGGVGVGRGYLNRAELTAEKFIRNPLLVGDETTLYRTGDLVRWSEQGELEFVGRVDNQVKIRGFRIELDEIEQQLTTLEFVKESFVCVRQEQGYKQLVAYFVAQAGLDAAQCANNAREALAKTLPDYMQPSVYMPLDTFPLTPNGKIDRKALPVPQFSSDSESYVAPTTEVEKQLCAIWEKVLGAKQVGVEDNFFSLGGDSILAIQVVAQANKLGISVTTKSLIENKTIKGMADNLATCHVVAEQGAIDGELSMLPIQKYYFEHSGKSLNHFNQSVLLNTPEHFDFEQLSTIVAALVTRHDVLRLSFQFNDDALTASHLNLNESLWANNVVHECCPDGVDWCDWLETRCQSYQESLDIQNGEIFKAVYLQGKSQGRLLFVVHHLVVDGVSWRILLSDLAEAYEQVAAGQVIKLASKTSSYKAWGQAISDYALDSEVQAQIPFWNEQQHAVQPLPFDKSVTEKPLESTTRIQEIHFTNKETEQLLYHCGQAYRTHINELLLAGVLVGLHNWAGLESVRVVLEGHGREPLFDHLDVTQTMGWFTSIYPLRLAPESYGVSDVIRYAKERLRTLPDKGMSYSALAGQEKAQQFSDAIVFNYLGQFDQGMNAGQYFTAATENKGLEVATDHPRWHPLNLNGMVKDDQLYFELDYSTEQFNASTIETLAEQIELGIREVIKHCAHVTHTSFTPSDFSGAKVSQSQLDKWQQDYPQLEDLYLATPMQAGMMYHSLLESSAYVTQLCVKLSGAADPQKLQQTWQQLVGRHKIFRTSFVGEEGALHQLVSSSAPLMWQTLDWQNMNVDEQNKALISLQQKDKSQGYDFAQAPLMRLYFIQVSAEESWLLWSHHHMLLDGWCLPLVLGEMLDIYAALDQRRELKLTSVADYGQYIQWLNKQDKAASKLFWQRTLAAFEAPTPINLSKPVFATENRSTELTWKLSEAVTSTLKSLAKEHEITVNSILQFAWSWLLHIYSNETHVMFGTTVSGRPAELNDSDKMVGLCINTIPVVFSIDKSELVVDALKRIHANFLSTNEHGYLAMTEIQAQSQVSSECDLYNSLLVLENYPMDALDDSQCHESLKIASLEGNEQTSFALSVLAYLDTQLRFSIKYNSKDFADTAVERLGEKLEHVLLTLGQSLNHKVEQLDVLSQSEQKLMQQWNDTGVAFADVQGIDDLFVQQARKTPDAIAVSFDDKVLTYQELDQASNRLAHLLIEQGLQRDNLIGLCLRRTPTVLVAMLAVLKAGAAYVPIDPDSPADRIAYIVSDSNMKRLLTTSDVPTSSHLDGLHSICLDDPNVMDVLNNKPIERPNTEGRQTSDLAYAIYTSGSTGQPKGTLLEHRGLCNLAQAQTSLFEITPQSCVLMFASIAFDAATWEWSMALISGARLHIISEQERADVNLLQAQIQAQGATHAFLTPALLPHLDTERMSSIRHLIVGGEAYPLKEVNRWTRDGRIFHNAYGPSETTCIVTTSRFMKEHRAVSIGKAIANVQLYVVDEQMKLLPIGVPGELLIGGDALGRGYLNRPELTAEKFIDNPFEPSKDSLLYRSGDIVRWMENGELEFVSRVDNQVKLRGLRIELGEIEYRLTQIPHISEALVLLHEADGRKYLVAYCVTQNAPTNDAVRVALAEHLPDYMIPSAHVMMDAFPLNVNGKIDRRALPEPELELISRDYEAPRTDMECRLCEIWQSVLNVPQVGIQDNFFALGGDSILSIQVVAQANKAGIGITTRSLVKGQTIAALVRDIKSTQIDAQQSDVSGVMPLLAIQSFFLDMDNVEHARNHFNQSVLLQAPSEVTVEFVTAWVHSVYKRHDALRLRFKQAQSDEWVAEHYTLSEEMVNDTVENEHQPEIVEHDIWLSTRCDEYQRSLDITNGSLFKAALLSGQKGKRLFLALHHLVVDGVSWRILLSDLADAYEQWCNTGQIQLSAKTSAYKAWSLALRDYGEGQKMRDQLSYWQTQLRSVPTLPFSSKLAEQPNDQMSRVEYFEINSEQTHALLKDCHKSYHTQINDLLLSGVYLGLNDWSGHQAFRIMLEGHGREELFEQLNTSQTIGWFTAIHPLILAHEQGGVKATIVEVKESLRRVPNKGVGYGLLKSNGLLDVPSDLSSSAIVFNYLGQMDQAVSAGDNFPEASESKGRETSSELKRWFPLNINCMVKQGRLRVEIDYSTCQFSPEQIKHLAQSVEKGFIEVIEHCQESGVSQFTPSDFPLAQVSLSQLDQWQQSHSDLIDLYPATPMQQGMHFHGLMDKTSYVTQLCFALQGDIDPTKLRQAWQQIVQRHKIFRTYFVGHEELLHQLVVKQVELPWVELDWRVMDEHAQRQQLDELFDADRAKGMDFSCAPLMRFHLIRMTDRQWRLLWSHHHMLLDGWCLPLILQEMKVLYSQADLALEPAADYGRYAGWLSEQEQSVARQFWQQALCEFEAPTPLSIDRLPDSGEHGYKESMLVVPEHVAGALSHIASKANVSVNSVLQLCWGYVLHVYSGETKVMFGTTVSGRPGELERSGEMIGLFINTIPIVMDFNAQQPLLTLLEHIHAHFQQANLNAFLPLSEVQSLSNISAEHELFDSLFVFENYPEKNEQEHAQEIDVKVMEGREPTHYKLTVSARLSNELQLLLSYRSDEIATSTIDRLKANLAHLFETLPKCIEGNLDTLSLVTEQEKACLLGWNPPTDVVYQAQSIQELFAKHVTQAPNAPALLYGEYALSYAELDSEANKLAHYLKQNQVETGDLVGICLARSPQMIVAMLAILKVGAAYVPIDPDYPLDRIEYMLQDTQSRCVITSSAFDFIPNEVALHIDSTEVMQLIDAQPNSRPDVSKVSPDSIAHVIYTSGSTGKPKGVCVPHQGVIRLIDKPNYIDITTDDVMAQVSNCSFDAATFEVWGALCNGAKLVGIEKETLINAEALLACIAREKVSIILITTAIFNNLISEKPDGLSGLKYVLFGGEKANVHSVRSVLERGKPQHLLNLYGPTENSTVSTFEEIHQVRGNIVPIGKPISATSAYVVDKNNKLLPIGAAGELLLGGVGLAHGYLNKPEKTAEAFIPDPFNPGQLLYRTGDIVRWLPDGSIEFLGRADNQVKIRGFRVECGEIENQLNAIEGVENSIVVVDESKGQKILLAYIVLEDATTLSISDIRTQLSSRLPEYMLPGLMTLIEEMPLTPNGKVDRRALPEPDYLAMADEYQAPDTELEIAVVNICAELLQLGTEQISITANFFELGGHSLLATKLCAKVNQAYGVSLQLKAVFDCKTLKDLAAAIELLTMPLASDEDELGFDLDELGFDLDELDESEEGFML